MLFRSDLLARLLAPRWPDDVAHLFQTEEPPKIPGAGPALSTKLAELATTEIYTGIHTLSLHDALPTSTCWPPPTSRRV